VRCQQCGSVCLAAGELTGIGERQILFECPVCTQTDFLFGEPIQVPLRVFRPAERCGNAEQN